MNEASGGVEEPSPRPPCHFRLGREELTVYSSRHKMTLQSFKFLNNYRFTGSSKVGERSPGTLARRVNASAAGIHTELVFRHRQGPPPRRVPCMVSPTPAFPKFLITESLTRFKFL